MLKNQYLINREYLIQLENEQLIDKISKLEKQLALKEAEIIFQRNLALTSRRCEQISK